jgi:hypothetical protein
VKKIAGHVPRTAETYRQLRMYALNFPSARRKLENSPTESFHGAELRTHTRQEQIENA